MHPSVVYSVQIFLYSLLRTLFSVKKRRKYIPITSSFYAPEEKSHLAM